MSAELVSLRMLVTAEAASQQDLWQKGAALASVPIDFAAGDAASTIAELKLGGVDICVVDGALPDADKAAVTAAARAARPAPLLFASIARGSPRPDNVDAALSRPAKAEDACKLVEICVRGKISTSVLIVDDSSTMRSIVRKILSASRFALNVHEAAEGIAALKQLSAGKFGLVFLDYNMPGLNGFETLAEIRRVAPDVSVVMMTSTLNNVIADRAHAAGALAFLKKPFYPADIDAVLERYFCLHVPLS
jgi:CheY-like chemotaxis protein